MKGDHISLILLPTLMCNADCEYCFEKKTKDHLTLEQLAILMEKIVTHMDLNDIKAMTIHWQGGEVMTLPPEWYERAHEIIQEAADAGNKVVTNGIQSNMISYNKRWNKVIAEMFHSTVGSSLDFPNLHRKLTGGSPEDFNTAWFGKVEKAREAGIRVGVISIPNVETLRIGAERFYSYFVDELQITDFQVNTPFPGGEINDSKKDLPLDTEQLSGFLLELADVWMERGYANGVRIGPFDVLIDYFLHGDQGNLPCIWRDNCTREFVCIDPRGYVSQCDCWVTSYPEYWFGNIFEPISFTDLLGKSEVRRRFLSRPSLLIQKEDCIDCGYLALCHGGCPIRTYTVRKDLFTKDPYCKTYQSVFAHVEDIASKLAGIRTS